MAGITLEIAQARLDAYLIAEERLLTGHQSHRIGDKEFRKSDLVDIQAGIKLWSSRVESLAFAATSSSAGRSRSMRGIPA